MGFCLWFPVSMRSRHFMNDNAHRNYVPNARFPIVCRSHKPCGNSHNKACRNACSHKLCGNAFHNYACGNDSITGSKGNIDPLTNILLSFFSYLATHTLCAMYTAHRGGWRTQLAHSLRSLARFRLRGPRSFAPAPVSQASGLLLVLLDQDSQANTPPMRARTYIIKRSGQ